MTILEHIKCARPDNTTISLKDISNWSYLNLHLQAYESVSMNDLLYLLGLELKHKCRGHIIRRLYSKYLNLKRKQDLAILLKETL